MASRLCDVCGVRPATVAVRRIVPGEGQRVEHLCEVHAAQARGRRSPFGGGGLFDEFFDRFFESPGEARRIPVDRAAPQQRAEQVDITQFFSDSTNELLQGAAHRAMEWGSRDLTSEHLLYATLEDEVVRRVLQGTDADPEAVRAQLEEEVDKQEGQDVSPSLDPVAKRA